MNFNELKELIQLIDRTGLSSFQYQKDGVKLKIEKSQGCSAVTNTALVQAPVVETQKVKSSLGQNIVEESVPKQSQPMQEQPVVEKSGNWVNSPLVGIYYASPNPTSPQFITVGQKVKKGDVLCIIEAMKVMNEIVAPVDGEIIEIKATNEKLVEFGEELVKIG